jgi:hypothetical protein
VIALSLAAWGWLRPATLRAETDCAEGDGPVVRVAFTGTPWDAALRQGVLDHLRAGLEPTGVRVCPADGTPHAGDVATVELRQTSGERVMAAIEVRDGVTQKRVARDIDVSALPEDARALGVGVAADELLRASWVELRLTGAPKPAKPPPPAVARAVESSLVREPPEPGRTSAGVAATLAGYSNGLLLFGGELSFARLLGDTFGVELALDLAESGTAHTPHGTITAGTVGARGSLLVQVVARNDVRVALEAGVWAGEARLRGRPATGAVGAEASAVAVAARAGIGLAYRFAGPFTVAVRAGVGAPLRAVVARDFGVDGEGIAGFEWYASLGPGVTF